MRKALLTILILFICSTCYAADRYQWAVSANGETYYFDGQTIKTVRNGNTETTLYTWVKRIADKEKPAYDYVLIHTLLDFKARKSFDIEKIYYKEGKAVLSDKGTGKVKDILPGTVWETVSAKIYNAYLYQIKEIPLDGPEWKLAYSSNISGLKMDTLYNTLNISYDDNKQYLDCWIKNNQGLTTFLTHLYININTLEFKELEKMRFDYKGNVISDNKPLNPEWIAAPPLSSIGYTISNICTSAVSLLP